MKPTIMSFLYKSAISLLIVFLPFMSVAKAPLSYTIEGLLVDDRQSAVSNAKVILENVQNSNDRHVVTTDKNGQFSIDIYTEGTYAINVIKNMYFPFKKRTLSTYGRAQDKGIPLKLQLIPFHINNEYVLDGIYFDLNTQEVEINDSQSLKNFIKFLKQNPTLQIQIGVHTDSRGDDNRNLEVSQERAEMLFRFLINKGINMRQITVVGYGETQLTNHCKNGVRCSSEAHKKNRRVSYKSI